MVSALVRFGMALGVSTSSQQLAPLSVAVRRSPPVRATRPSAVGEPGVFTPGRKYKERSCFSAHRVAGVAGAVCS